MYLGNFSLASYLSHHSSFHLSRLIGDQSPELCLVNETLHLFLPLNPAAQQLLSLLAF